MTDNEVIADLRRRVQKLEDIEAMKTLRNLYHHYINDGTYELIRNLVTEDAVVHLGYLEHYEGIETIHRGFVSMSERERFFIKQFIHSHTVTVDGDSGTGFSYLEARYGRKGTSYLVSGKYDDVYVRQNGKWLFKSMMCEFFYTVPASVGWTGDELHYLRPKP